MQTRQPVYGSWSHLEIDQLHRKRKDPKRSRWGRRRKRIRRRQWRRDGRIFFSLSSDRASNVSLRRDSELADANTPAYWGDQCERATASPRWVSVVLFSWLHLRSTSTASQNQQHHQQADNVSCCRAPVPTIRLQRLLAASAIKENILTRFVYPTATLKLISSRFLYRSPVSSDARLRISTSLLFPSFFRCANVVQRPTRLWTASC